MITSDETCGSFSSSNTSDTFPGNNISSNKDETVSTLFSSLFNKTSSSLLPTPANTVAESKKNTSTFETDGLEKIIKSSFDFHKVSSTFDSSTTNENDTSLPLSTDTVILERNKSPPETKAPTVSISTLYTDDMCEEGKRSLNGLKLVDAGTLRRVCSSSKIPVSTKRLPNTLLDNQKKERACRWTEKYPKKQLIYDKESTHKRAEKTGSKKYDHIKSKVAAYIHRPTRTELAVRGSARSMSPIDCKSKIDHSSGAGEGIKRMSSRTSIETYTCEYKMPSADTSFNLDRSESSGDPNLKIRKHVELALEHNRRKLEKERMIAEHHQVIAKQHQQVVEHSEKANESLQKAFTLLLCKMTEKS